MIKILIRLLGLVIIFVVALYFLAPRLLSGAGNSLVSPINNSSASGIAQLVPDSQGKNTTLQVKLDNLLPKTNYEITLNEDQCSGPLAYNAGTVTTDQKGSFVMQSLLPKLSNPSNHTLWLAVHQGGDPNGPTVACGHVQVNGQALASIDPSQQADTSQQAAANVQSQQEQSILESVGSGQNSATSNGVRTSLTGLPQTGVAPAGNDTYDNYTFPRKY